MPPNPTPPGDEDSRQADDEPQELFGISFDTVTRAQEFLLTLARLAECGHLRLRDAAVVVKTDEGKVHVKETIDPQPGRTALSAAAWTGLLGLILGGPVGWIAGMAVGAGAGALTSKAVDLGIPDEWIKWFTSAVQTDTATVVALVTDVNLDALVAEAQRFAGAELVHTTLAAGAERRLLEALESSQPWQAPMWLHSFDATRPTDNQ